ncbi:hypothetical protein GJ496_000014 [Pomphorhynchus laevis]|nr:hypothetical protein GJ496_000014 [Pomphorhynchus laevis]
MSSLVAYESSDDETTNVPGVTISDSVDQLSGFSSKPIIIQSVKDPMNNRTKIIIEEHPNEYDSDSEDEVILHQSKRLKTNVSSLLSMLPAPTSIKDDDQSGGQPYIELNTHESNYFDDSLSDEDAEYSDNDDNISPTEPHYFSLNKLDKPIEIIESKATSEKDKSSNISNEVIYSVNKNMSEETQQQSIVTKLPQLPFDEKLVSELSRMCKRGHSFKWTSVQADELRGNSNEQLLKNITTDDEIRSSDKSKMSDNPIAKRKHQMTYLANLAKSQEHELRQQWSQSTSNRRESRARYGF